jgi:hypothetical protein
VTASGLLHQALGPQPTPHFPLPPGSAAAAGLWPCPIPWTPDGPIPASATPAPEQTQLLFECLVQNLKAGMEESDWRSLVI